MIIKYLSNALDIVAVRIKLLVYSCHLFVSELKAIIHSLHKCASVTLKFV